MSSREKILSAVKQNQPSVNALPELNFSSSSKNLKEQFIQILTGIGGKAVEVSGWNEIALKIQESYPTPVRVVNSVQELNFDPTYPAVRFEILNSKSNPHDLKNVTVAIMEGDFGVAENGAIWLTDASMGDQALPYICENLVLIIKSDSILPSLHEAYTKIGNSDYRLGTFIAGPSKTADIEQSLVLGAHGSKSLLVFLIN